MDNILDTFKKQGGTLDTTDNNDLSLGADVRDLEKETEKVMQQPDEVDGIMGRFHKEYPYYSDKDLMDEDLITQSEPLRVVVKRAFCPKCQAQLISKSPTMYNPYTLEKIAKHECKCGFKCNLDHAYPRIAYLNCEGEEIIAFND